MRYTLNSLRKDVESFNKTLEGKGHEFRLVIELFNNSTWISKATLKDLEDHTIHSRLEGGSPKECYEAGLKYTNFIRKKIDKST